MPGSPPLSLARFYRTTDYAVELLRDLSIALVRAPLLNDPFDPYFFFETDVSGGFQKFIKDIDAAYPGEGKRIRKVSGPMEWRKTMEGLQKIHKSFREHTYILSFTSGSDNTKAHDNLYLWGHYADGHRGLCIEFDTESLSLAISNAHEAETGKSPSISVWNKIIYRNSVPVISNRRLYEMAINTGLIERYATEVVTIKHTAWSQENEWRLMWRPPNAASPPEDTLEAVHRVRIPPNAIKRLYLGMRMPAETALQIQSAAKECCPGAEIWDASKKAGALALEFHRIS